MAKIINLKSNEDVTAAVEQLWETGAREVYFVMSKNSVLLKNTVALRLLKREADRLEKAIVLITKDEVGRETAKRVGLSARVTLPRGVADTSEDLEEEELASTKESHGDDVLKEMPQGQYESLIKEEVKLKRELNVKSRSQGMSDIRPKFASDGLEEELEVTTEEESSETTSKDEEDEAESQTFNKHQQIEDDFDSYLMPDKEEKEYVIPRNRKEEAIAHFVGRKPFKETKLNKEKKLKQKLSTFLSSPKSLSVFIGLVILVSAAVLYFVLPKVEVVLVPKSEMLEQDLILGAFKSVTKVDVTQSKIPAQSIKIDEKESKEFIATGERQLNDKAKGTITIFNEYSSASQSLVEKTRFVAENGKVFRLVRSVVVPGAKIDEGKIISSSIDAEVVADEVGEAYNIGLTSFKIPGFQGSPKYDSFYARSKTAMTGGATGLAKVVSQDDFNKAKVELWQTLKPKIEKELRAQSPANLKILDQAIKEDISSIESNVPVGGKADKFTLSIKGFGAVILFDENDIYDLTANKNKIVTGSEKLLDEGSRQVQYSNVGVDFDKGQLNFSAKVSQKIVWQIDIDGIKRLIAGKKETEIRQIFGERQEIDKARILFWPFWVKTVPDNHDKIKIKLSSE